MRQGPASLMGKRSPTGMFPQGETLTCRKVSLRGNAHQQECSFKGAWSTYRNVSGQPPKKRSRHLGKNLTSSRAAGGAGERRGGNEGGQTRYLSPSRVATLIPRSSESQSADLSDRQWWYPSSQLYAVHSSCTLGGLSTEYSVDIQIFDGTRCGIPNGPTLRFHLLRASLSLGEDENAVPSTSLAYSTRCLPLPFRSSSQNIFSTARAGRPAEVTKRRATQASAMRSNSLMEYCLPGRVARRVGRGH